MNDLAELCEQWLFAKESEDEAKAKKDKIAAKIVAITGQREEGDKTTNAAGFKITTTGNLNRKMDWEAWELVKDKIPAHLHPVKNKPEVDNAGAKYLKKEEPEIYKLLPLTVTPGKTGVKVELAPAKE